MTLGRAYLEINSLVTSTKRTVFIDTSIAIARTVHDSSVKSRIQARLDSYDEAVTGLVVKQEYKRRLLKEALYLLNQFNDKGSYQAVIRHVINYLPHQQGRKKQICLQMLTNNFPMASDRELTERAMRYLRTLLRTGLTDFMDSVDQVYWQSGCACSNQPIRERIKYKRYDFGSDDCVKIADKCGILNFFKTYPDEVRAILALLKSLPASSKSEELKNAEKFIEDYTADPDSIYSMNPCLTVGDLVIALESIGVENFYTLNSKESQHLCRALEQNLIVRPVNPVHEDKVFLKTENQWDMNQPSNSQISES